VQRLLILALEGVSVLSVTARHVSRIGIGARSLTQATTDYREVKAASRNLANKRLFDLSIVLAGAIVWIPAVAICALALLVVNGRPVFYRSMRHVSRDRLIRVFKFRTMVKDADKVLNRETVPITSQRFLNIPIDSPAYTRAGRIVERIHFTELPQFFHVLRGTMSIVGSRPLPANVFQALLREYPHAGARFGSPAGMTGLAQLIGRESVSDEDRLSLEAAYCQVCINNYSPLLDLEILTKTLLTASRLMPPMTLQDTHRLIDKYRPASGGSVLR
jgi:lipopolysaccharide/colanic/teichoic acid biosynthesis glycosyltransferase